MSYEKNCKRKCECIFSGFFLPSLGIDYKNQHVEIHTDIKYLVLVIFLNKFPKFAYKRLEKCRNLRKCVRELYESKRMLNSVYPTGTEQSTSFPAHNSESPTSAGS